MIRSICHPDRWKLDILPHPMRCPVTADRGIIRINPRKTLRHDALRTPVEWSVRYLPDFRLPDEALDFLTGGNGDFWKERELHASASEHPSPSHGRDR